MLYVYTIFYKIKNNLIVIKIMKTCETKKWTKLFEVDCI